MRHTQCPYNSIACDYDYLQYVQKDPGEGGVADILYFVINNSSTDELT